MSALADTESCVCRIISGLSYEIVTNDMSALNHFIMALLKEKTFIQWSFSRDDSLREVEALRNVLISICVLHVCFRKCFRKWFCRLAESSVPFRQSAPSHRCLRLQQRTPLPRRHDLVQAAHGLGEEPHCSRCRPRVLAQMQRSTRTCCRLLTAQLPHSDHFVPHHR